MSWCPGVRVSGCLGVWVSRCLGVQVSRCPGVWVYGCAGVWVYGCPGVWVSRCLGVQMARCPGGSSPPFIAPLSYQVKMLPHSSLCFHQTFTAQGQLADNGRRRPVRQLHSVTQTRSTRFWVWVNQSWPADQMLCNYPGLMTLVGWCV